MMIREVCHLQFADMCELEGLVNLVETLYGMVGIIKFYAIQLTNSETKD